MLKLTSTILGLTMVAAFSASEADAAHNSYSGASSRYAAPVAAAPYSSAYGRSTYGTTGCSSCAHGQCGTGTRAPYAYGASNRSYFPSTGYRSRPYGYGTSRSVYPTSRYSTPYHSGRSAAPFYGGY